MKKLALITGGSSGIGAAAAKLIAKTGYDVVINYRNSEQAATAIKNEIMENGGTAYIVQSDISTEEGVNYLFNQVDKIGSLDALINSAGIISKIHNFESTCLDQLNKTFSINVFGSFLCAREAVKRMSHQHGGNGGCIVNLSSMAASLGSPNEFIEYAASKGAIDTLTVGLAKEVAKQGIRVNAVRPGLIDTDMHSHTGDAERAERLSTSVPMDRVGTADEVAELILWLISEKSSYVCGALYDVSGGR
ncbi:SDR family oxidoreductase [Neptuniibacter sp. PT8_73]|uniref:SDR family oxidoreductase n=1 Tax=Neptuniibacter sp. PT8_73 TaxID=3398206 RepID=UPI0039F645CE